MAPAGVGAKRIDADVLAAVSSAHTFIGVGTGARVWVELKAGRAETPLWRRDGRPMARIVSAAEARCCRVAMYGTDWATGGADAAALTADGQKVGAVAAEAAVALV